MAMNRPGSVVILVVAFLFLEVLGSLSRSVSATSCEVIRIPMCRSMPYNITQIPNLLHHSNQLNALLVLEQYQPLVSTNCSPILLFFLCALFTPVCPVNFSQDVIPPCQDVCLRARRGCEPVLEGYNLTWPRDLDCDGLPPYETGVCISPEAINSSPPKKARMILKRKTKTLNEQQARRNTTTKDCPSLSKLLNKKSHTQKSFDFVFRVTLMKVQTIANGQISLLLLVREIFKSSPTARLNITQSLTVLLSLRSVNKISQCRGLRSLESHSLVKDYLMVVEKERKAKHETSFVCQSECHFFPWKKSFHKTIQSWKRRQQKKMNLKRNQSPSTTPPNRKPSRKSDEQKHSQRLS